MFAAQKGLIAGTHRSGDDPEGFIGEFLHHLGADLGGGERVVDPDLRAPVGRLLHPAPHLLHQVEGEVGAEAVLVQPDLPGETGVLNLPGAEVMKVVEVMVMNLR